MCFEMPPQMSKQFSKDRNVFVKWTPESHQQYAQKRANEAVGEIFLQIKFCYLNRQRKKKRE